MNFTHPDEILAWDDSRVSVFEGREPFRTVVRLPWSDVIRVRATDPWPDVTIESDAGGHALRVRPDGPVGTEHPYDLGEHVDRFLREAEGRGLLAPGWERTPGSFWEPVPALPAGRPRAAAGAFRTAAAPSGEDVVLRDPIPPTSSYPSLPDDAGRAPVISPTPILAAVAGGYVGSVGLGSVTAAVLTGGALGIATALARGSRLPAGWVPWIPRDGRPRVVDDADVVVTTAWVVARRRNGTCWRLPRPRLRLEIDAPSAHQSRFVFDRFAELRVGHHRPELLALLRGDLERRRGGPPTASQS